MGCRWVTIAGRRVRVGPVEPTLPVVKVAELSPAERLRALGLFFAAGSPTVTVEELAQATIRLFDHGEMGWLAEAKFKPADLPIYHYITEAEAEAIKTGEITPQLIARLFEPHEPVMN